RGDRGRTRSGGAASRVRLLLRLGDPGLSVAARSPPPAPRGGFRPFGGGGGFGCGCCFGSGARDYRLLLARNLALAGVAFVAWRAGEDAPLVRVLGEPAGADLLPVALVVLGLALAVWVGAAAFAGEARRNGG